MVPGHQVNRPSIEEAATRSWTRGAIFLLIELRLKETLVSLFRMKVVGSWVWSLAAELEPYKVLVRV